MQRDIPWIHSVSRFPVKVEAMAERPMPETSLPHGVSTAWGDTSSPTESPVQQEQHGSESESATACGTAAALDSASPEVNSVAGNTDVKFSIPPAAWPFIVRKPLGVPIPRVRYDCEIRGVHSIGPRQGKTDRLCTDDAAHNNLA